MVADDSEIVRYIYDHEGVTPEELADTFNNASADERKAFFAALQAEVRKADSTVTKTPATESNGKLTFSDLSMGGYLISVVGAKKVYSPIFQSVAPKSANGCWEFEDATVEAAAKSSEPGFQKKIDVDGTLVDNATAAIGSKVKFSLQADVLSYPSDAVDKKFEIQDVLSSGLTFDEASVAVKADGTSLTAGADYTVSMSADGRTVTFDFKCDSVAGKSKVVVEYEATVIAGAVVGIAGNPNNAKLVYSNNPSVNGSYAEIPDDVRVYTFGIEIFKLDKANQARLLGAEFKLYGADDTTVLKFVQDGAAGSYRLALESETGTDTLVVDAQDHLNVRGLADGTYKLEETKAPAGYARLSGKIDVTLHAQRGDDGEFNGDLTDKGTSTQVGYKGVNVLNGKGWSLPTTGDMGIFALVAAGILLVGGGIVVVRGRRAK